jgi:hypothetical protein
VTATVQLASPAPDEAGQMSITFYLTFRHRADAWGSAGTSRPLYPLESVGTPHETIFHGARDLAFQPLCVATLESKFSRIPLMR